MVNKSVVRLRREHLETLPPALEETLPNVQSNEASFALVCRGNILLCRRSPRMRSSCTRRWLASGGSGVDHGAEESGQAIPGYLHADAEAG